MNALHRLTHKNSDLSFQIERLEKENKELKQALNNIKILTQKLVEDKGYAELNEDKIFQILDEVLNEG